MSRRSEEARTAMRRKARRLAGGDPHEVVDASGYQPATEMDAEAKINRKPRAARKDGGKVEGERATHHAGKKPRTGNKRHHHALGGPEVVSNVPTERFGFSPTTSSGLLRNAGLKRGGKASRKGRDTGGDVMELLSPAYALAKHPDALKAVSPVANLKKGGSVEKDLGTRPTGGREARKHGGRADAHWIKDAIGHKGALHRELHVPEGEKIPARKIEKAEHSKNKLVARRAELAETLEHMHRPARKDGGKASKGKMNVNIIIDTGGKTPPSAAPGAPVPPPPGLPPRPMPVAPGAPMPMGQPMPPPGAAAPPVPMPRKRGGEVKMTAGAKSGIGRLEKTENAR